MNWAGVNFRRPLCGSVTHEHGSLWNDLISDTAPFFLRRWRKVSWAYRRKWNLQSWKLLGYGKTLIQTGKSEDCSRLVKWCRRTCSRGNLKVLLSDMSRLGAWEKERVASGAKRRALFSTGGFKEPAEYSLKRRASFEVPGSDQKYLTF